MTDCNYCNLPFTNLLSVELGEDEEGTPVDFYVYCDGQRLCGCDSLAASIGSRQINYCPMCGRRINETMAELKPCPFCGCKANITETYIPNESFYKPATRLYNLRCSKCRAEMHGKRYRDLVEAWNRRTNR